MCEPGYMSYMFTCDAACWLVISAFLLSNKRIRRGILLMFTDVKQATGALQHCSEPNPVLLFFC